MFEPYRLAARLLPGTDRRLPCRGAFIDGKLQRLRQQAVFLPGADVGHRRQAAEQFLVERIEEGEQKVGGIIIPDSAKEKPQEGEIVSVGSGAKAEDGKVTPLDVKAGDRILFGKWSGTEVKVDGEDLIIMKESDILGVIG